MPKNYYLPLDDTGKDLWLKNFANKLPNYAAKYGISATEVADITQSQLSFTFWLNYRNQFSGYAHKLTGFKNELRDGINDGGVQSSIPAIPNIPNPVTVAPGIFKRTASLVNRIKSHQNYAVADGQDMRIEGADQTATDFQNLKPVIQIRLVQGGRPEIVWKQNKMSALEIWVKREDETEFTFLAIDTRPNYIDKEPLPLKAAKWQYKAIYRLDDEQVGHWSDTAFTTVVEPAQ